MLFEADDFAERVSASGMSVLEYARRNVKLTKARLQHPATRFNFELEAERRQIRREARERLKRELRRVAFRENWKAMVELAQAEQVLRLHREAKRAERERAKALKDSHTRQRKVFYARMMAKRFRYARALLDQIAAKHGLTADDLKSDIRAKQVASARREFYWTAAKFSGLSNIKVGAVVNKTCWSVLHGVRQHQKRLDNGEA